MKNINKVVVLVVCCLMITMCASCAKSNGNDKNNNGSDSYDIINIHYELVWLDSVKQFEDALSNQKNCPDSAKKVFSDIAKCIADSKIGYYVPTKYAYSPDCSYTVGKPETKYDLVGMCVQYQSEGSTTDTIQMSIQYLNEGGADINVSGFEHLGDSYYKASVNGFTDYGYVLDDNLLVYIGMNSTDSDGEVLAGFKNVCSEIVKLTANKAS